MSSDHYLGISLALRMDREQRAAWHYNADALRRAAKRLSRIGDDALMDKVANHKSAEWWCIEAFRTAVTGGQG